MFVVDFTDVCATFVLCFEAQILFAIVRVDFAFFGNLRLQPIDINLLNSANKNHQYPQLKCSLLISYVRRKFDCAH